MVSFLEGNPTVVPPLPVDGLGARTPSVTVSDTSRTGMSNKRKYDQLSSDSESDSAECDYSNDDDDWNFAYEFSRQGESVAVAYNEGYFIGEIIEVKAKDVASVQFMKAGYARKFTWPSVVDCDENLDSKFVFCSEFPIINNGRYCEIPGLDHIEKLYNVYKRLFLD